MSDEDDQLLFQDPTNTIREYLIRHLRIDCTQRIIQKHDVGVRINSPCKTNSSFLPTRDIDASLSNNCLRSISEYFQIPRQLRCRNALFEPFFVKFFSEEDVLLNTSRENERLLFNICN